MSSATGQRITAELARMRMWRRIGDEREADLCNDRINNLLDRMVAGTMPLTVVDSREADALSAGTRSTTPFAPIPASRNADIAADRKR